MNEASHEDYSQRRSFSIRCQSLLPGGGEAYMSRQMFLAMCQNRRGSVRTEIPGGLQGHFFVCAAIRFYGVSRRVKRAIAPPLFNLINIKKKGWRRITMKKTCFYKDLIYLCLAFAHKRALKQGLCDLIMAGRGQGNARRRARETWQMPSE